VSKRATKRPTGLVLGHGAGGNKETPVFLDLEERLDVPVHRFDFPYRVKSPGRRPPDRMPKLLDSFGAEVADFADKFDLDPRRLVMGGRSMGGRVASIAVAQGLDAAALVLLSYPLHPPRKPDKLRVDHFGDIGVPCLFVMGDRDPFGTRAEFEEHLAAIPAPVTVVWLEGANHSPKPRHDEIIVDEVSYFFQSLG